jgi:hypothetical protein
LKKTGTMPATVQTDPADGCPPALPRCDDLEPDATPLAVLEADMAATLDDLRAEACQAAEQARAANTERAYAADWRNFSAFCARIGREHLPAEPETITLYLADLMHRGRAAATWARRLSAIAVYHRVAGFSSSPTEHEVVRSVHRGLGVDESTCPVRALQRWLERAEIFDGRVFRRIDRHGNLGAALSNRAIAEMVRRRAADVGLEGDFGGRSLRAGLATSAARAGKTEASIMRHGRWRSVVVARRYIIRAGQRWDDNAAAGLL